MHVTFLGGAEEIGASCSLLEFSDGFRVLIDCGQRLNAHPGAELPDFSLLESGPPLRAILLTHAHADHIGGLPALEPFLDPECRIYGTEATLELARVMLNDTVQIMTRHRQGDGQFPLFPAGTLAGTFARFTPVRFGKSVPLANEVRATWFPSGHLLGAGMIEIKTPKESALFSGDVAIADLATVAGAFVPALHPTLLVLESTYGNRLHAHRPTQERKIVERVAACLADGGRVLFPTFALGRAQDVLLLLGLAMRRGELDRIPVYADGLVRSISKVYSRFAEELSPPCRRIHEQGLDPVFPEDLPILPVRDNSHREQIARGGPCVMVSSSGMLQGGASQFYATHWIHDPRNLILITGYQDEESPGEALLNLSRLPEGAPRFFKLGGIRTEVTCQVESFSLSAHADNLELTSLADKLRPRLTLLVHGDTEAREMLANSIAAASRLEVVLPRNGESYRPGDTRVRRGPPAATRINPLALWPPWDPLTPRELELPRLHAWLVSLTPRLSWVTLEELAELWRSPEPVTAADLATLRAALANQTQPYFVPEARRPFLLRLTPLENLSQSERAPARLPAEQAAALVPEFFPEDSGLRRFGFYPEEGAVQLEFRFPRSAARHQKGRITDFTRRTGWTVSVNDQTDPAELIRFARELTDQVEEARAEVRHVEGSLRVPIPDLKTLPDRSRLQARFLQHTGYHLVLVSSQPVDAESGELPGYSGAESDLHDAPTGG